jgi:hypothetical protein
MQCSSVRTTAMQCSRLLHDLWAIFPTALLSIAESAALLRSREESAIFLTTAYDSVQSGRRYWGCEWHHRYHVIEVCSVAPAWLYVHTREIQRVLYYFIRTTTARSICSTVLAGCDCPYHPISRIIALTLHANMKINIVRKNVEIRVILLRVTLRRII